MLDPKTRRRMSGFFTAFSSAEEAIANAKNENEPQQIA
jgi:hypothetical protein